MAATEEIPSEASRAEAVAEAGMGADSTPSTAIPSSEKAIDPEKAENGERISHSGSSDGTGVKDEKSTAVSEDAQRTLDTTIITTAVPTIATRFQASEADYTWIGSAYLLAAAASTPTWGKFSDIWGRKPILLVANIVFLVGSLIAALSINIKMLLAGRAIQGIGGGGLIILANICVSDLFSMR
ncbi:MAG: hypothetical protein Q9209_000760 [Squamulea sp. 1 TL-2023]